MPKKILMIGNGFDLAHGLPTQYKDFLIFCKTFKVIYEPNLYDDEFVKNCLNDDALDDRIKQLLNNIFMSKDNNQRNNSYLDELYKCIENNLLYEHFRKILVANTLAGENWIDFESEIANNVKKIEQYRNSKLRSSKNHTILAPEIYNQYLRKNIKHLRLNASTPIKEINNITFDLYTDLNRLIRALEIYLSVFVSAIKIDKPVTDLQDQSFDYVLSFNYTDTYERVFKEKAEKPEICYLHGKANKDATTENCNLVLGIDEYLPEAEKNSQLTFLPFKKFYQRIYKFTDNSYSKWIDDINDRDVLDRLTNEFELHIFGHSLDVTDKDILSKFILNDNVQTKIYYYQKNKDDKSNFSSKIRNLIKIIGQDELIKRTGGGSKNTIEFIPQTVFQEQS